MELRCMLGLWDSGRFRRGMWCSMAIGKPHELSFCSEADGRSYVRPLFSGLPLRESMSIKVPGV